ncbi:stability/partitioning determinant [Lichenihabitans sp. Uapishka_5]|uniref:stability/partitioning determinant n=1 Tax=Lichenihabitans sp. Uapishka_5 TaxID=3037302 RepID=UPI0029E7FD67|nr:stability/partitioning determinant [Lichenihabitans sp. Uapishka_5]MDX7951804.1 stability/partitioning determinant [Lichenihabitans sp. Uapishka_5]
MGRASILEPSDDENDDIDLSRFQPKQGPAENALPPEQVRAIAEASNFPSRDPKPRREKAQPEAAAPVQPAAPEPAAVLPRRQPRRHRTGRTMQFNARTTPATVDAFYAIADQQGWLVGETVERALAALQRELKAKA